MRTKKLRIDCAESIDNGLCFYSKCNKEYVAFASIDEEGMITSKWMQKNLYQKLLEYDTEIPITLRNSLIAFVLVALFILVVCKFVYPFVCAHYILSLRIILLVIPFILVSSFLFDHIHCSNDEKEKRSRRFHSAEHMAINAFQKLQRVPSLEEVKQFSRFHSSCGTNQVLFISLYSVLIFICTFIPDSAYPGLLFIIASILISILFRCGFLNFLQTYTTLPPTDTELMVAIAGLTTWYENETKEKKKSIFSRLFPKAFH